MLFFFSTLKGGPLLMVKCEFRTHFGRDRVELDEVKTSLSELYRLKIC